MTKTRTPPIKPPRVSVPITDEVHVVFKRLGKASNMSTGAAIADWLTDSVEAAEFMALKMEQARAAPKAVMREMHAYALGLADETGDFMRKIADKGRQDRAGDRASGATHEDPTRLPAFIPPSSNTGGKVPRVNPNTKEV